MAFRIFSADLIDKHTIRIKIKPQFYDSSIRFTLAIKNQPGSLEIPLLTSEYYQNGEGHIYHLKAMQALDLNQQYLVYDFERNVSQLKWGPIVRTADFDEFFYYAGNDLGAIYQSSHTVFKLWAPISEQVFLVVDGQSYAMARLERGVWQADVSGDWDGKPYYYLHLVNGVWQETQDPYALSAQANSGRSFVINPEKIQINSTYQNQSAINQAIIYEMSVRDFSSQKGIPFKYPKQYLGLSETPEFEGQKFGLDYVKKLGVTHIQLLPVYDFGSVDETQVDTVYNWGYDPMLYNVPEGGFASNPHDPYARIKELQAAIKAYHDVNIGVIMDVVYNHVYDVDRFVLEKIVPGYCSRFDIDEQRTNGTGCGNDMATERKMVRKFIVDSILIWLKHYGFDGFRFDLMGILDIETMQTIEKAARDYYPNVYLYGEGWQMGTGLDTRYLAHQFNSYQMPGISFFNDRFREELKKNICHPQLLVSKHKQTVLEELLTGSFGMIEQHGRYLQPSQSVNYLECHDNATFFDYLTIHHPGLSQKEKEARASLGLQLLLLSQGVVFIHAGQEAFRTKNLIDNTYNQPDAINRFDWLRTVQYKDHISFIQKLITFRKSHPVLSLLTSSEMQNQLDFYWFNQTVLKYSLHDKGQLIEILINLGDTNYVFENTNRLDLHIQAPQINLDEPLLTAPTKIMIPPMSLAVLMSK